jgi:3D (Asp-Asp-Asp) domain-containing protein
MNLTLTLKNFLLAVKMLHTDDFEQGYVEYVESYKGHVEEVVEVHEGPHTYDMEATFYTSSCRGCTGYTKHNGYNVKNTIYVENFRVIAVDPKFIKMGSIVRVELENGMTFKALAADIGGDIKNNRIDVLVSTKKEAYSLGRMKAKITIIGKDE